MGLVCATCGAKAAGGAATCPKCGGRLAASVSETLPFDDADKRRLAAIAKTVAAEPPGAGGQAPRKDATLLDPELAEAAKAPLGTADTLALPDGPAAEAAVPDAKATIVLSEHDALINQAISPAAGQPAPYVPPRAPAPERKSKKGRGCIIAVVVGILLLAAAGGITFYVTQHTSWLSFPGDEPSESGEAVGKGGHG